MNLHFQWTIKNQSWIKNFIDHKLVKVKSQFCKYITWQVNIWMNHQSMRNSYVKMWTHKRFLYLLIYWLITYTNIHFQSWFITATCKDIEIGFRCGFSKMKISSFFYSKTNKFYCMEQKSEICFTRNDYDWCWNHQFFNVYSQKLLCAIHYIKRVLYLFTFLLVYI